MNAKRLENPPEGYRDYTVYPLEGLWTLSAKGQAEYDGSLDKDELVFRLMTRQPDGVSASFAQMEAFCDEEGLTRRCKDHREIYLSDFRKTAPEKSKTVLRFQVD